MLFENLFSYMKKKINTLHLIIKWLIANCVIAVVISVIASACHNSNTVLLESSSASAPTAGEISTPFTHLSHVCHDPALCNPSSHYFICWMFFHPF